VGPTKRNPRRFNSRAIAVDSGVVEGTSEAAAGRGRGAGANDHSSSERSSTSAAARALAIVDSILARLRTMPWSAISRATSASV
jgi:hypothetical protein